MHYNQCNQSWFQTGFPGSPGDFSGGVATLFAAPCITTATSTLHLSSFLVARYPSSYFNQWVQIFQRLLVRSYLFLYPNTFLWSLTSVSCWRGYQVACLATRR